jgi:hypothetical protein
MFVQMHSIGSDLNVESDFCKIRVRDMWHEMYKLGRDGHLPKARLQREKRGGQWLFGEWIPDKPVARAAPTATVNKSQIMGVAVTKDVPESTADFEDDKSSTTTKTPKTSSKKSKKIEASVDESSSGYEQSTSIKNLAHCACRKMGLPGARGLPGKDGKPGKDAMPGKRGRDGSDGVVLAADVPIQEPCIICPVGPQGLPGLQGPRVSVNLIADKL